MGWLIMRIIAKNLQSYYSWEKGKHRGVMKVTVTGGNDFIRRHAAAILLKDGHTVSIYDHTKSVAYPDLCTVADVGDKEQLAAALQGVDAVYHMAAEHRDDVRPAFFTLMPIYSTRS